MVERILDAAQEVLIEFGFDGASTNRIAKAAGVSPASIYQYFPDKEAVAMAAVRRFTDRLASQVSAEAEERPDEPAAAYVRRVIRAVLNAMDVDPRFLAAAINTVPQLGGESKLAQLEGQLFDLIAKRLHDDRERLRPGMRPEAATWLLVRTIRHLTVDFMLEKPDIEREEFIDELATLVLAYVAAPPRRRGREL
jgi:AcrR family transcriptional regulator